MSRNFRYVVFSALCIAVALSARAAIDEADIVGIWLFDEIDGDMTPDSSGNGNDAIVNKAELVDGKVGKGFEILAANAASVFAPMPKHDTVTIAMWAQYYTLASNNIGLAHVLAGEFENADVNSKTIGIWVENTGNLWGRVIPAGAANVNFPKNTHLDANTWYHIAMVVDADAGKATQYVDGKEAGQVDYPGALNPYDHISIGRQGTESWDGVIDEVIILSAALTPDELKSLMNGISEGLSVEAKGKLAVSWGRLKQAQ
ncbi:MAG: LamG domain-containing protein [Candidatus Poribacteria bacterium]|nr:LamG domain-containing protein [Candidatus Poribacteria bacterium]